MSKSSSAFFISAGKGLLDFSTLFNIFGRVFKTVFKFLKPIGKILGKIFFPINVIIGSFRVSWTFFNAPPGKRGGLGGLLKSILAGLLETFTFGLIDIDKNLMAIFDKIVTGIKLAISEPSQVR